MVTLDLDQHHYRTVLSFAMSQPCTDGGVTICLQTVMPAMDFDLAQELEVLIYQVREYPIMYAYLNWILAEAPDEDQARKKLSEISPENLTDRLVQAVTEFEIAVYANDPLDASRIALQLFTLTGAELPGWAQIQYAVALNALANSGMLSQALRVQADRQERMVLDGVGRTEIDQYESVKSATKALASQ